MSKLPDDTSAARRAAALGKLKGKRALVTGGAGFVGSHIVDLLVEGGASEVTVIDNMVRGRIDNLTEALQRGNVRVIVDDIRDEKLLRQLVEGQDIVFHQAALRITHCAAEPRAALDVMIVATFELLQACVQAKVPKVVMASSASIYGLADTFPTPETQHPYDNRTLYGAAKLFAEGLLRSLNDQHGLDYVALRYFNVYGPRMDIHGKYTEVMIRWMERLAAGEPPIIFGDGQQTIDLVHVRDVAFANILAATSSASDMAFNIGSGAETSLLELADRLARVMNRGDLKPIHQAERAVNPVPRRQAGTEAARALIGFETEIGVDEGIRDLVDWWISTANVGERGRAAV